MDLSEITDAVTAYCRDNPIIAVAVGLLLLFLLIRKTKLFFFLLFLGLILAAALYFIMGIAETGKATKGKMIEKGTGPDMDQTR